MAFMNNGDGEFYELIPRGVDLEDKNVNTSPVQDTQFAELETCRRDFLYHCGYDTSRPMENNAKLCCKIAFIIRELPSIYQPEVLIVLLSDRTTLFSDAYADYRHNHEFLKGKSREISADPEKQAALCAQDAWKSYASIFSKEKRYRLEQKQDMFLNAAVCIDKMRRIKQNSITYYREAIFRTLNQATEGTESSALFSLITKWNNDEKAKSAGIKIPLDEADALQFCVFYFAGCFCSQYLQNEQMKKEAGHFRPEYTQEDYSAFQLFNKQKSMLVSLFEEA